jgi:uncharacterized protein YndB with AHSA1/START domain
MQTSNQETLPDVQHTVVMNAPIQKVWDAVTTSEGIAAWFMPNTFVPGLGEEFTITSQFGVSQCKVTEFDPPHRMMFTWDEDWVITFQLQEADGKTQFTLTHGGWQAGKLRHGMPDEKIREIMGHGWEAQVLPGLVKFVEA